MPVFNTAAEAIQYRKENRLTRDYYVGQIAVGNKAKWTLYPER